MLSILIPVFNFEITSLVRSLHEQCEENKIQYEIFCLDDTSSNQFHVINSSVSALPNVLYKRLEKNLGRSRIRNKLAQEAKYENLLFMDCDSEVVSKEFIKTYIPYCNNEKVTCGGRVYEETIPADRKKILRWKSGRRSEETTAAIRNRNPFNSFMTNNFLISKKIFLENRLDESLSGYGHEDTLFGFQLK
ncbi:MAG: glycosyltransferase, partial [Bacteroidia bacterium]|nr:glycosyltransferase [Bacteroidia bacterium]